MGESFDRNVFGSFFLEPHFESGAVLGWVEGLGWPGLGWGPGWPGLGWGAWAGGAGPGSGGLGVAGLLAGLGSAGWAGQP